MRTWIRSACVVLAWSILPIILVAVSMRGSVHPAQANTRNASTTEVILTSTLSVAAPLVTDTSPATRYVVRSGDTLSGIAARFAVRGGWPALYAANRQVVGRDPDAIHPGMVLTISRPPAPVTPAPGRAGPGPRRPAPPPPGPAGIRHHPRPARARAPIATGMPQWLRAMLLALGLLILAAFIAEPILVMRRRRQEAAGRALRPDYADSGQEPDSRRLRAARAPIILADHDRLVVTRNQRDGMVYVLRPPGADPKAILQVARLVLPEGPYGELARQLGVPAGWRME